MSVRLLDSLATTGPLAEIFSDRSMLAGMLLFEVALARVEARLQLIPAAAARHIADAARPELFDAEVIAREAWAPGTIAIPLVRMLIARVRDADPDSAAFVHWGATSQDVTDTALVICLAHARPLLLADHERLTRALRALSDEHAGTVMLARTLMQPATPMTFGLKAAGWWAACERSWARLSAALDEGLVLQFGGPSGTLVALGDNRLAVASELARDLDLSNPDAPWHAHRDRLAALVAACGLYAGALGKIARDVTLMMQPEVGEASERGGGSSSMPHKRNPAGCAIVLAAATRLPGLVSSFLSGMLQEHERGVGGGHADAPTIAAAVQATGAALQSMREVIEGLSVDAARMRANLEATGGVMFAERAMRLLAPAVGRDAAERAIADAIDAQRSSGGTFREALAAMPVVASVIAAADLATLDSPDAYVSAADVFRRRLLAEE